MEEEGGCVAEGGVGGAVDGHHVRGLGDEQHQAEVLHREIDFQVPGEKLLWCQFLHKIDLIQIIYSNVHT